MIYIFDFITGRFAMRNKKYFYLLLTLCMIALLSEAAICQNAPSESGQPGGKLISKIEAKLGKPLTMAQKMQLKNASLKWRDGMNSAVDTFAGRLSTITGISLEEIKGWMPKIGYSSEPYQKDVISKIETKLGKKLTAEQMEQIMKASGDKKASMSEVMQTFVSTLAGLTGLTKEDLQQMLPQMDTHAREKQGASEKPQQ
jgi:hypothetical protein